MTEQSPNDIFKASSFLQGHNAEYIEQLYARYANDPNAVDEAWQQVAAILIELTDNPGPAINRPVVQLPGQLVLDNAAFFLDHEDFFQALRKLRIRKFCSQ